MNPSSPKPSSQAYPALQQAGPYAPAAGPPRARRRVWLIVLAVLVTVIGLMAAFCEFMIWTTSTYSAKRSIENARAGSCVTSVLISDPESSITDCSSADAAHRVTGRAETATACALFPGTDTVYDTGKDFVCLAETDTAPDTAVNSVKTGDCVTLEAVTAVSQKAVKTDCADGGVHPVLAVLNDVEKGPSSGEDRFDYYSGLCARAGAADVGLFYSWHMRRLPYSGRYSGSPASDIVLCLGPQH